MSSPLDKPTLDTSGDTQIGSGAGSRTGNRAGTSAIGRTTTDERARFQLSREMKILLGVLALGAAVGGWYVFSGIGTPAPGDVTSTVSPQTSTAAPQTGPKATTPSGTTAPVLPGVVAGTGVTPGAAAGGVRGGAGPVDVAQVPFLNPQGSATQGAETRGNSVPGDTALAGINPADPLAAVPGSNPFQPLTVINTNLPPAATAAAQPGTGGTALSSTQLGNTIPGTSGVSVAGAVPLPNVPIAGISSGGAALGGSPSPGPGTISAGMPSGGAIPLPVVPIGGLPNPNAGSPGNGGAAATAGTSKAGTVGAGNASPGGAAPVARPMPAAGSITPGLTIPTLGGIPLGSISSGTTAPGNTPTQTDPAATAPQPGVISQYGSANVPAVPVAPVISALDQLVQSRSLVFNAVVLGPINTAIFKTDKGFVVVPTGQTLPDSTVTLGEVTATSATLTLGSDSKILELDKR